MFQIGLIILYLLFSGIPSFYMKRHIVPNDNVPDEESPQRHTKRLRRGSVTFKTAK